MIKKSDSTIPQEWLNNIENSTNRRKIDYKALDNFILMYYDTKTILAISKACNISWSTIDRRIEKLKKAGKLNE